MAVTYDQTLRIGGADIEIFTKGNGFVTPLHSITDTHEDGVKYSLENFEKLVKSGRFAGLRKVFQHVEVINVEVLVPDHTIESMALSFGQPLSAVTEDAVGPPPNVYFDVTGALDVTEYEVRIKAPQPADPTLFDIALLQRVSFIPVFDQAMSIQTERYIPLQLRAYYDTVTSKIGRFYSEGV